MSALSYMTNGLGSPVSGASLSTGGYTAPLSAKPLYRVANTHPVYVHNREWHERPMVHDNFVAIPSGNTEQRGPGGSYPLRALDEEQAVALFPIFAVYFARGQARIRRHASGVQVLIQGYYRYDEGDGLESATKDPKQFNRTLTFADWERLRELLSNDAVVEAIGELPSSLSPLSSEWAKYRPLIEGYVRALYG